MGVAIMSVECGTVHIVSQAVASPEEAPGLSWRSYPCLGQLGPLSCFVLPQWAIQPRTLGDNSFQCTRKAVPILDSTVAPRWALHPELAGNCFLGSDRRAWMLFGTSLCMLLCTRYPACLECTRMSCPKGHHSLTWECHSLQCQSTCPL